VTGRGRLIDVSLLDGLIGMMAYMPQVALMTGQNPVPQGNPHPTLVPYGVFPASDGLMVIACLSNNFWGNICRALGLPDLINDERYSTIDARRINRAEVDDLIAGRTRHYSFAELDAILTTHQVPHAPILGVHDALMQPQAVARDMVVEVEHAALGRIPIVNRSIKWPGEAQPVPDAPPILGQHTDTILSETLGLDPDRIAALRAAKVVS
jgi:crotonobetainyl-CoA:carnitine CoA-transferase CaiB-like acyl-CoA transferase